MRTPALILSFVLAFGAGAAVGAWTLWMYMMGGGTLPTASQNPAAAAPAAAESSELPVEHLSPPPAEEAQPAPAPAEPEKKAEPEAPTPTSKGHWTSVETPGRPRDECLKLTKGVLNDEYKDCRFGTQKKVWVDESGKAENQPTH